MGMDLATVSMERQEARKRFLDYRRAVRERHSEEDAQIMRGYRVLAQGNQVIHLTETLRAGGSEIKTFSRRGRSGPVEFRLPRLAVTRADAKVCFTTGIHQQGGCHFAADKREQERHTNNRKDVFRVPNDTFEAGDGGWRYGTTCRAIVPNVPPPFRPARGLAGYMILWEAEWALDTPPAPVDPALLKHIGGDLYAVVAIWELSELERSVLSARAVT